MNRVWSEVINPTPGPEGTAVSAGSSVAYSASVAPPGLNHLCGPRTSSLGSASEFSLTRVRSRGERCYCGMDHESTSVCLSSRCGIGCFFSFVLLLKGSSGLVETAQLAQQLWLPWGTMSDFPSSGSFPFMKSQTEGILDHSDLPWGRESIQSELLCK